MAIAPDGHDIYLLGQVARARIGTKAGIVDVRRRPDGTLGSPPARCPLRLVGRCVPMRHTGSRPGTGLIVSADGTMVYAADAHGIVAFRRTVKSGRLAPLPDGCVGTAATPRCRALPPGLATVGPLALSSDGRDLYAATTAGVAGFKVGGGGALSFEGCIASDATPGCVAGRALTSPSALAVSRDGHNVYVASRQDRAVADLARDSATGALTQPADPARCLSFHVRPGCRTTAGIPFPDALALSPDDRFLLVASAGGRGSFNGQHSSSRAGGLATFSRTE
jgi:hypothetical protein